MSSLHENNTDRKQQNQGQKRDGDRPVGKAPAFQFYPKDFLTDDKVLVMSNEERGAYITLLCIDWLNDGIKADDFQRLSGLNGNSTTVQRAFNEHPTKKGYLTNGRLQKERVGQANRRKQASEAGKESGRKRKELAATPAYTGNDRSTGVEQKVNPPSPSPSPSPSPKEKKKRERASPSSAPMFSEKELIGTAPQSNKSKIPGALQEFFKSRGKIECFHNVWLSEDDYNQRVGDWGVEPVEQAIREMSEWSVNLDISAKTGVPGWKSFRQKRDHAKTLDNLLKRRAKA